MTIGLCSVFNLFDRVCDIVCMDGFGSLIGFLCGLYSVNLTIKSRLVGCYSVCSRKINCVACTCAWLCSRIKLNYRPIQRESTCMDTARVSPIFFCLTFQPSYEDLCLTLRGQHERRFALSMFRFRVPPYPSKEGCHLRCFRL
jgi:hypothetical protein